MHDKEDSETTMTQQKGLPVLDLDAQVSGRDLQLAQIGAEKLVQKKKWLKRWCREHTQTYNDEILHSLLDEQTRSSKPGSEKLEGALALVSLAQYTNMHKRPRGKETVDKQGHRWGHSKKTKFDSTCTNNIGVVEVEDSVKRVLSTAGVAPEEIVSLISQKKARDEVIEQTGFSSNYIMKLQRRVLRSSNLLQLPPPDEHRVGEFLVHVLFNSSGTPLFIKKELCQILNMKGTTFSYWKKKAGVSEMDTSQDFRLMDQCRSIFGGRSTYTLYTAQATSAILDVMESSRQRGTFVLLPRLTEIAASYTK